MHHVLFFRFYSVKALQTEMTGLCFGSVASAYFKHWNIQSDNKHHIGWLSEVTLELNEKLEGAEIFIIYLSPEDASWRKLCILALSFEMCGVIESEWRCKYLRSNHCETFVSICKNRSSNYTFTLVQIVYFCIKENHNVLFVPKLSDCVTTLVIS